MQSDFLHEGYADKKELEEIEKRLFELRSELLRQDDDLPGRTGRELRAEVERLEKKAQEIHLKLEHLEHEA